jgi:hypothetical protein
MTQWYYAQGGQQKGPVAFEELRNIAGAGGIAQGDLVWNASMTDWVPAGSVEGLFGAPVPQSGQGAAVAGSSNPYAAPGSALGSQVIAPVGPALEEIAPGSEPLDIIACIKRAFELTKRHFGVIILTGLVFFGVTFAVEIVFGGLQAVLFGSAQPVVHNGQLVQPQVSPGAVGVQVLFSVIGQVLSLFLSLGATRIGLNVVSGREASVGQLFSQGDKLLRAVGASIIFAIAVFVGCLLLIVPGIYIALRFGQYATAIVDRNMGIMEAFNYSSSITTNNRMNLFGLGILCFLIVIAGLIALCVGVIFAAPIAWLAVPVAYRCMQYGQRALLDDPATQRPLLASGTQA